MGALSHNHQSGNFRHSLDMWFNRRMLWLSKHWLAVANTFFFAYVGLPLLAPILLAAGFTRGANSIYFAYNMVCHQFPTRAYFFRGEQVAMCQRCVAMYITFVIGGIVFNFVRMKPLAPQWLLLFALPMALDGGTAFISELSHVIPMVVFWVFALVVMGIASIVLFTQKAMRWQVYVAFLCGLLALFYLQIYGPRISNFYLRTITGTIFIVGVVWFAYPTLEEGFVDTQRQLQAKLNRGNKEQQYR